MNIVVVLGTRPEIVKLAPVIGALSEPPTVVHTGQHYDSNMAAEFFDAFDLPEPSHRLEVGGKSRGEQIGSAVTALDLLFDSLMPSAVVAQGDTNSTMAAAIAANARSIPFAHVEAGLRSYDRAMPEEHNRVVADHLSDLCLAPTATAAANLEAEGIEGAVVRITGNTVVDAVMRLLPAQPDRVRVLTRLGLVPAEYVISTFHRPENVDDPDTLRVIVTELASIDLPVLLPLHPRTRAIAERHDIDVEAGRIRTVDPLGYVEFLALLAECRLAVSDSGGLQEEVSVLKRPMVVVRHSTERPEVLGTFCTLVPVGPGISSAGRQWLADDPYSLADLKGLETPYGDGRAGARCVAEIEELLAR